MTAQVVREREVRAHALLGFAFVGVPVVVSAYCLVVDALLVDRPLGGARAAYAGWVVAALGVLLWIVLRRRPGRWPVFARVVVVATTLALVISVLVSSVGAERSLPLVLAAVVPVPFIVVGVPALAARAARRLTMPLVPDMADSAYEWAIPVRGMRRVALTVGTTSLEVRKDASFLLELLDLDSSRATKYPLSAVSWVWDASISGTAPANLPRAIRGEIDEVSGPAVGLRVYGHDWVLPVESADAVVALLRRRIGLDEPGS
ncbi:hypothetical protein [Thermocrispum sp.]|uniref:Uncharacterized protein n=1 Tax=Thermocrispum agreste TaxID=37925 RepID=A0A2W4L4H3_9PSEU|nr:hypothetical protein [Thermocrispum sp.]PZM92013.1 MAG: hypothetical protein DIU77_16280 [Thermocrispum agreste]